MSRKTSLRGSFAFLVLASLQLLSFQNCSPNNGFNAEELDFTGATQIASNQDSSTSTTFPMQPQPQPQPAPVPTVDLSKHPNRFVWLSPQANFSSLPGEYQYEALALNGSLNTIAESGIFNTQGQLQLGKVADPDNASRRAFQIRISNTDPADAYGAIRTELNAWAPQTSVKAGKAVWIAFAMRLPPMASTNSEDVGVCFQCHTSPTYGKVPPFVFYLSATGSVEIQTRTPNSVVLHREAYAANQWQWYVVKAVFSSSSSDNPYVKIYRAVGEGNLELIADRAGPNLYPNQPECFLKQGYYKFTHDWLGAKSPGDPLSFDPKYPTRVVYNKGIIAIYDSPELTPEMLLQNLKSF